MKGKILGLGIVTTALLLGESAQAVSIANCAYPSPLKSRDAAGRLVPAWSVVPGGGRWAQVATAPNGVIVVLIETSHSVWEERPLYWPTPSDPKYAYRKMRKLPTDTAFSGNDESQNIRILPYELDFPIDGEMRRYTPINYNGRHMVIDGCGEQDNIYGGAGNDHIYDYAGTTQLLSGDAGRDWVEGAGLYIIGGPGDDCITGIGFPWVSVGGLEGNDFVSIYGDGDVSGGPGRDSCAGGTQTACEATSSSVISCNGWL